MPILRIEFLPSVADAVLPPAPLAAASLPLRTTPTPDAQQPTVPFNPVAPGDVFVRLLTDRPAYVVVANRPQLGDTSKAFIVLPGAQVLQRAYPGQRVAAQLADAFASFSQADVDGLLAAAMASFIASLGLPDPAPLIALGAI